MSERLLFNTKVEIFQVYNDTSMLRFEYLCWLEIWHSMELRNRQIIMKRKFKQWYQQFHQYQQNEQSPIISTRWKRPRRWKFRSWLETGTVWQGLTWDFNPPLLIIGPSYHLLVCTDVSYEPLVRKKYIYSFKWYQFINEFWIFGV